MSYFCSTTLVKTGHNKHGKRKGNKQVVQVKKLKYKTEINKNKMLECWKIYIDISVLE